VNVISLILPLATAANAACGSIPKSIAIQIKMQNTLFFITFSSFVMINTFQTGMTLCHPNLERDFGIAEILFLFILLSGNLSLEKV